MQAAQPEARSWAGWASAAGDRENRSSAGFSGSCCAGLKFPRRHHGARSAHRQSARALHAWRHGRMCLAPRAPGTWCSCRYRSQWPCEWRPVNFPCQVQKSPLIVPLRNTDKQLVQPGQVFYSIVSAPVPNHLPRTFR